MKRICHRKHLAVALLAAGLLFPNFAFAQTAPPDQTIDAVMRAAVIEGALKQLNDNYVFPEIARQMEQAIRERVQRKEYDGITSAAAFAAKLTADLREVCQDKHLRVLVNDGRSRLQEHSFNRAQQREIAAKRNFGFEQIERLPGNVGYLDVRGFEDKEFAADTAAAAMNFLANTDALIIDLRNNGGGQPEMVALLCSYLFEQPAHLNSIYSRPDNRTREFWTHDVAGKRYLNKEVFVLTSNYTFSGGEEFTYNLKNLKRATIIGETTGGGAHPVMLRRINDIFAVGVPFARAINPITKTNWEGVGVAPDVKVPAPQALKVAHLAALKNVLPRTDDPQRAQQLKGAIANLQKELDEAKVFAGPITPLAAAPQTPNKPAAAAPQASPAGEVKLPDTPAGRTFGKFIAAFNTGDRDTLRKFHRETGGDEGNADQDMGLFQQTGGLMLRGINRSAELEIEAAVQAKNGGNWLNFSIAVAAQAPHAITDIRVQPGDAPNDKHSGAPPKIEKGEKPSEAEALKQIAAWLDEQSAADQFSGAVLIAKAGAPIWQRAYGAADKQTNAPNRLDTKFNLGSINKIFTQIAVRQLADQGKLALTDTIAKHLPDYPNQDAAAKVTIKHLLEMQSGIGDFFGPKFEAMPKERLRTINDYLPLFAAQSLAFEPGTKRAYSNGGYIVLGALIEKVTGRSYYDYVREHIYRPAGMNDTDHYETGAATANLAHGYTRRSGDGKALIDNVTTRPARGSSAGGGYATAGDLLKFTLALQSNKLLSPASTQAIMRGGLGIAGGAPGINAVLEFEPGGYTVIVLSNYDPPTAEQTGRKIQLLLGMN